MTEPVFGIPFDPAKVHYAAMPEEIRKVCPEFKRGRYWTFAHTKKNSIDYFIVLGLEPHPDGDSFGTGLEIDGSHCREQESKWLLSGHVPPDGYQLSGEPAIFPGQNAANVCDQGTLGDCHYELRSKEEEVILRELIMDGMARSEKAWGGAEGFKKQACHSQFEKANYNSPIVRQELSKFCRE